MPRIKRWDNLPEGARRHLIERMSDRAIGVSDINRLRLWALGEKPSLALAPL
jgi:hypothetical protein